jgi:rSAM/selenodomain-associated transferase 2
VAATISVVIPALDEEDGIAAAIASVRDEAAEVIVADGGSADATRERAAAAGARVITAPRGRGLQQIEGARQARGQWIVFLHADTRLEPGWSRALREAPPGVVLVAFRFAVDSPRRAFRLVELGTRLRCRLFRLPYGDQALSVRRAAYHAAGGFLPLPLMEDVDLVRRLRGQGALAVSPLRALTSGRRWERRGVLRGTLRNWSTMALYALGVSPERLRRRYERLSR